MSLFFNLLINSFLFVMKDEFGTKSASCASSVRKCSVGPGFVSSCIFDFTRGADSKNTSGVATHLANRLSRQNPGSCRQLKIERTVRPTHPPFLDDEGRVGKKV